MVEAEWQHKLCTDNLWWKRRSIHAPEIAADLLPYSTYTFCLHWALLPSTAIQYIHILSTLGSAAFYSLLGACPETLMLHAQFRFFFFFGGGGQIIISIMNSSRHRRGGDTEIALKIIVAKFYCKVGVFFKY